jgi:hypothetical protein
MTLEERARAVWMVQSGVSNRQVSYLYLIIRIQNKKTDM